MEVSYRPYFRVNEFLLTAVGQWPYLSKLRKRIVTVLIFIALFSMFLGQVLEMANSRGDIDNVIEDIPNLSLNMLSIYFLFDSASSTQQLELLLSKIKKDFSIWTSGPELEILHSYSKQGRKFVIAFTILIYSNMLDFMLVPLIPPVLDLIVPLNETRPRRPIFDMDYIFVKQEDIYYLSNLHIIIGGSCIVSNLLSVDTMFIACLYHACGELAILGFKLKNLVKADDDQWNIYDPKIHQEIKLCVEKHESIIIFVNDITKKFSTAYFLFMGSHMIMMSVTGVQTVMNLDQPRDALTYAIFTAGLMFHLFCLTLPCQNLIDHSDRLSECIYDGNWYQLSSESQKLLQMIMMRNTKVSAFTAGKLYTFSMENFAAIVRTSMSYFTVLSSLRE